MKTCGGVEVQFHEFLVSALDVGEWTASRPGCFIPGKEAPGTHWRGDWVGRLDATDKEIKSLPLSGIEYHSSNT
jgi:hypothetical protein